MSLEALLPYFERELEQLRAPASDFARRHPHAAPRLGLEADSGADPRVERLVEAFAFLTARIQKRLDEDHREISTALLQVLHPLATQPIPSATVLAFQAGQEAFSQGPVRIPRHQTVLGPDLGGRRFTLRTTRDLELWPLRVVEVRTSLVGDPAEGPQDSRTQARIILDLEATGGSDFAGLDLEHLEFFLEGEPSRVEPLAEALLAHVVGWHASLQDGTHPGPAVRGSQTALRLRGLSREEALLDPGPLGLQPHRLLMEWFAFPDQFRSIRLSGLNHPDLRRPFRHLRLTFDLGGLVDPADWVRRWQSLPSSTFRLGCTPALNLFPAQADPIRLTHRKVAYPIRVETRRSGGCQVHHVQRVCLGSPEAAEAIEVPPFFGFARGGSSPPPPCRWHTLRSPRATWNWCWWIWMSKPSGRTGKCSACRWPVTRETSPPPCPWEPKPPFTSRAVPAPPSACLCAPPPPPGPPLPPRASPGASFPIWHWRPPLLSPRVPPV